MATRTASRSVLPNWGSSAAAFVAVGVGCIVAGGLVSAIIASSPSQNGSWAVAYLVLIAGVAQIALGVGQARLAVNVPSRRIIALEFVAWNAGNAAVVAGQLLGYQWIVDIGGIILVVGLALFYWAVRGAIAGAHWPAWTLYTYRIILLVVLVSIPIGLIIGHVKAS